MATTAQIDVLINAAQSAKTLGELDKALGDINAELKNVEIGSDAFKQLKTQADATQKAVNNINISGFESKLKGFEATTKTISSSLSFATGAMALFGAESESTEKILKQVAGAMAISTAFKDFAEAQKAADESGKGLNKTLLGNPFILILGLLLPLITQLDSFKDIMKTLSGIAGELFKTLQPLIDAFMMLLNSVFKALLPIINTIAKVLIQALAPIFKVITNVLKGLNPLFQSLGKFLSENKVLMDGLTLAIKAALLPITVLQKSLEFLGVVEPINDTTEAIDNLGAAAQTAEERAAALDERLKSIGNEYSNINAANDRAIKLAEAQGKSEKEINDLKRKGLLDRQTEQGKVLTQLREEERIRKRLGTIDIEFRSRLDTQTQAFLNAQNEVKIFDANLNKSLRQGNQERIKSLQASQQALQNSYLALRDIQRDIAEEFVNPEQERFLGFFVDYRKRLNDVVKNITEQQKPQLQTFIDFINKTFNDPQGFTNFLEKYRATAEQLEGTNDELLLTFVNFNADLEGVIDRAGLSIVKGATKTTDEVVRTTQAIRKLIAADALIYDQILEGTIGDTQQLPQTALNALTLFFTKAQQKLRDGFDFATDPIKLSFNEVKKEVDRQIKDINDLLEGELTITQRERLKNLKLSFTTFLSEYRDGLKELSDEDIQAIIRTPLEKTLPAIFDSIRFGSSAAVIEFDKLREAFERTQGFDEFVAPVRESLINLGLDADLVAKQINKVVFDLQNEALTALELRLKNESEAISLSLREQEKARREASRVRIEILENDRKRANQLADEELMRFEKVARDRAKKDLEILQKQIKDGIITEVEGALLRERILLQLEKDLKDKRAKVAEQTAKVIKAINIDIDDEIKSEGQRRLERFAKVFEDVASVIRDASQLTSDFLNNLTAQQLINLESVFNTQVAQLEALKNQGLLTQREYDFERLKAQEKYDAQRRRIEKAAWERNYAIQIGQAIINTAVAVSSALAQFPGPPATIPASIVAGVLGGAQVAVIASQPKPKFARGGFVGGNGPGDADTVMAALSSGEFVINANATKKFLPLLKQLNQYDLPTIGGRETVASPPVAELGQKEPLRAYVVLDELNEKNERLSRIQNDNTFFRAN